MLNGRVKRKRLTCERRQSRLLNHSWGTAQERSRVITWLEQLHLDHVRVDMARQASLLLPLVFVLGMTQHMRDLDLAFTLLDQPVQLIIQQDITFRLIRIDDTDFGLVLPIFEDSSKKQESRRKATATNNKTDPPERLLPPFDLKFALSIVLDFTSRVAQIHKFPNRKCEKFLKAPPS